MDEKTCTRCSEAWPADISFFRKQPKNGNPHRLAPWCRACECEYARGRRAAIAYRSSKEGRSRAWP